MVPEPFLRLGSVSLVETGPATVFQSRHSHDSLVAFCFVVGHGAYAAPTDFVASVPPLLHSPRWARAGIHIAGYEPRRSIMLLH